MEPSLWDSFIESNMTFCISQLKAVFNIEKAYNHLQTSFIVRPWSPQYGIGSLKVNMTFCFSQFKAIFDVQKAYNHLQTSFI